MRARVCARVRACELEWVSAFLRGLGRGGGAEQGRCSVTLVRACASACKSSCVSSPWNWHAPGTGTSCACLCVFGEEGGRVGRGAPRSGAATRALRTRRQE